VAGILNMRNSNRQWLYLLFFVSGFCSLVYQMVWTRLAFASFGIITPVLSVVLSVFMLGLSVGAWAGGRIIPRLVRQSGLSAIFFYGGAEFVIGLGAFATPKLFVLGQQTLLSAGQTDSFRYLFLSALVLSASILPWCIFMGATFPWMMAYVWEEATDQADSFSYLYFANVLGAMTGTIVTAFVLVELFGFHDTLTLAATGNFAIAALSVGIGWKGRQAEPPPFPGTPAAEAVPQNSPASPADGRLIRWILFTTGFSAMAMEVVWTRAFTPVLKTQVYSFALIVFTYLGATFLGTLVYRRHLRQGKQWALGDLMALLCLAAFLPIIAVDPRIVPVQLNIRSANYLDSHTAVAFVLASICPVCGVLGYLTPSLIDRYASGHPAAAGKAYGINVIGCILGPLCASYFLLSNISERYAMVLLVLPLLGLGVLCRHSMPFSSRIAAALGAGAALVWSLFYAHDFEGLLKQLDDHTTVRRDYAASVISCGEGFGRRLLVNGVGMTALSVDTKLMVHLPMAMHKGPTESALIICFGMGTSYRSALSWDVKTTVVELVPSVVAAFGYYHSDTASILANPKGRIVIDDGRRFLKRTSEKYDIIVADPPPPPEAAGSSLLYSREFYDLAKEHLKPGGILQIWHPGGTKPTVQAVMRSLVDSFPYVRGFGGINGWGAHFLASMQPIDSATGAVLANRLPLKAQKDLEEWMRTPTLKTLQDAFQLILVNEAPMNIILNPDPKIEITDDQPYNEYYLLRQWRFHAPEILSYRSMESKR
jgi:spermidine synthase